jgi:hypothetical protein
MRIFGNVRAFECLTCNYMVLLERPKPVPSEPEIVLRRFDVAE